MKKRTAATKKKSIKGTTATKKKATKNVDVKFLTEDDLVLVAGGAGGSMMRNVSDS